MRKVTLPQYSHLVQKTPCYIHQVPPAGVSEEGQRHPKVKAQRWGPSAGLLGPGAQSPKQPQTQVLGLISATARLLACFFVEYVWRLPTLGQCNKGYSLGQLTFKEFPVGQPT